MIEQLQYQDILADRMVTIKRTIIFEILKMMYIAILK